LQFRRNIRRSSGCPCFDAIVDSADRLGSAGPAQPPWDLVADVVIVGFGAAGACAALAARESGADVLAIDRFNGGGSTELPGESSMRAVAPGCSGPPGSRTLRNGCWPIWPAGSSGSSRCGFSVCRARRCFALTRRGDRPCRRSLRKPESIQPDYAPP